MILLTLFLATVSASASRVAQEPSDERLPNVLLIIADDQGWADTDTPNLKRLAERGVRFPNAYASSPICNASRAAILTGCYQQRFGTYWYGGKGIHDDHYRTIAEVLRDDAGLATAYVGKFHLGSNHAPDSRNFPTEPRLRRVLWIRRWAQALPRPRNRRRGGLRSIQARAWPQGSEPSTGADVGWRGAA